MAAVCAILGAGPGVSQSVAKRFSAENYHIALIARNSSKLAPLQKELSAGPSGCSVWSCDVSNKENLATLLDDLAVKEGPVEVLIFNAYNAAPGKPSTLNLENFADSMKVNIGAALAAAQCVIPAMTKSAKGSILFTGGGFAMYPLADMSALSVGKAGLRALALCLHQELTPVGVHAGTVTICGTVESGSPFDPEFIAEAFIELHKQPKGSFQPEIMFTGAK